MTNVTCDNPPGYGGIGISYQNSNVMPKENEWVLLSSNTQTTWYRVVSAGSDGAATPTTHATLVGPDWNGGCDHAVTNLIVVNGVTGVYTTTVQLDNDATWSK